MKSYAGPMILLVVVVGFLIYRTTNKPDAPSRDYTERELTGPAPGYEGTCFELGTVLVANGVFGDVPRKWSSPREDVWTLTVDRVVQTPGGPIREFQAWTFEPNGDEQVRFVSVEASKGYPDTIEATLAQFLRTANSRGSAIVERCKEGGKGYMYDPSMKEQKL